MYLFAAGRGATFVTEIFRNLGPLNRRETRPPLSINLAALDHQENDPTWLRYFAPDSRPKKIYVGSLFCMKRSVCRIMYGDVVCWLLKHKS